MIGSLHPDEEDAAITSLSRTELSAVIAPRYIRRAPALERACRRLGLSVSRRSRDRAPRRIRILDTYGELGAAYGLAPISIIGGTFGRRNGQNLVEAAAHNNRIIHGPRTANIELERAALSDCGAVEVSTWAEAFQCAERDLGPVRTRAALGKLRGATQLHMAVAQKILDDVSHHTERDYARS